MPAGAVPGPTEAERTSLAALGGIAKSLIESIDDKHVKLLPPAVAAWMKDTPSLPPDLIEALQISLHGGGDPLAQVYERLVAAPRRRPLGTFFTPASISTYMTLLVKSRVTRDLVTVVDPGAGVGAFTRGALEAWPDAHVHAVDVNVATLGLLAATPAIASGMPDRTSLHHADFLQWLLHYWPSKTGPGLIWGNPPYTRHQGLSAETKLRAQQAGGGLAPGGRAGLSTYFLAASLAHLAPQDSLCLLLPANWLEAEYARGVRAYLWRTVHRRVELHIFPHELDLFPVASVAAMVVWVGPQEKAPTPIYVHRPIGDLQSAFSSGTVRRVEREGEPPATFMFATAAATHPRVRGKSVPLASLAQIRRGVATGSNRFFLLTDDQIKHLPKTTYVAAATRLRDLESDCLDGAAHDALGAKGVRRWMLWLTADDANDPAVSQLLDRGKFERVHEAHLCMVRNPWYVLERMPVPDLLFGPMAKGKFRLINNAVGAIPTNTFYGIRLRHKAAGTDPARILADWIRGSAGQDALVRVARQHGSGTLKIEPRDLADLRIPSKIAKTLDPA